jgi:sugar lactone lactonase YvrE
VIDIAFGQDGSLYVLEFATNSLLSGDPTGALIRINPDGTRDIVASAGLVFPAGVAVGPDGGLYVSNYGAFAGAGQVVRIEP